jgi:CHASE2 domain-containing sensor protein
MPLETAEEGASWLPFTLCVGSILVLLALFFVPAVAPALLRVEHWAADWRTAFLSDRLPGTHPRVTIIAVGEDSLQGLPYVLPINRGYLADLVTAADEAGAAVIGLDFYFTRDTEERYDAKLLDTLQRARAKIVLGVYEFTSAEQLAYQLKFISKSKAEAGYIDLLPDSDHVIRYRAKALANAQYRESFSSLMARAAGSKGVAPDRISWLLPPADGRQTFEEIAAHRFLLMSAPQRAALLKGRVVLIGGTLFSLDEHWTPLSLRTHERMRGVEIHAQMTAELIDANRSFAELDPIGVRAFVGILAALGILLGARFQGRGFDFLNWRVASGAAIVLDLVAFRYLHLMLPFTLAAVAWIAGVTAGTQLRGAISFSRSRWRSAA